jgi:hypothetical protein
MPPVHHGHNLRSDGQPSARDAGVGKIDTRVVSLALYPDLNNRSVGRLLRAQCSLAPHRLGKTNAPYSGSYRNGRSDVEWAQGSIKTPVFIMPRGSGAPFTANRLIHIAFPLARDFDGLLGRRAIS